MKKKSYIIATAWLAVMTSTATAQWVTTLPAEFLVSGDFDGGGITDVAVIDRVTGVARISFLDAAGYVQETIAPASGIDAVEGVSVGRILQTNSDAIAVTAPLASRINVLSASNRMVTVPASLFPSLPVGINQALAIDIGGTNNNPALDDVLTTTRLDNPANPWRLHLNRNQTNNLVSIINTNLAGEHVQGNRIRLTATSSNFAAFVQRGITSDTFIVRALTNGTPIARLTIAGLPTNTYYAHGFFSSPAANSHVITYQPGGTALTFREVSASGANFVAAAPSTTNLGFAIGSVVNIPGTNRLVVLGHDGERADVFSYTTAGGLAHLQMMESPIESLRISGIIPRNGGLVVLIGEAGGRSYYIDSRVQNGSVYESLDDPAELPAIGRTSGRANVWAFANDPLSSSSPTLLSSLNAADWSSSFRSSGSPASITVTGELYRGTLSGLGNPTARSMGRMPTGGAFGMVNQFTSVISVTSFEAAAGPQPGSISIAPAPGSYDGAVAVSFNASTNLLVVYRPGLSANWTPYIGPFWLFADTTVYFYGGTLSTNILTPIQTATYTFTTSPEAQDSDGDGVPDFVEIARGLDPVNSGDDADGDGLTDLEELLRGTNPALADSDGDGWSDMQELRAGTNPNSAASFPASADQVLTNSLIRTDRASVFDLYITPRPLNNTTLSTARSGTQHRVYGADASLYGVGAARSTVVSGVTSPHVWFRDLPLGQNPPLFIFNSDEAYPLTTTTSRRGRELVRVLAAPDTLTPAVTYIYGGGGIAVEASNWVAAATSAWGSVTRPFIKTNAVVEHTLTAALFEYRIEQLLKERAMTTNAQVTIFPWRSLESASYAASVDDLRALSGRGTNAYAAYDLRAAYTSLEHRVFSSAAVSITNLVNFTRAVYRVSSTNESGYALPLDALRAFIRRGEVIGAYSNSLGLSSFALTSAYAGVTNALAAITPRPWVSLTLNATAPGAGSGCTRLFENGSGTSYLLINPDGSPYNLTKTFNVISGTQFQVTGFIATPAAGCTGTAVEVESIGLVAFVFPSPQDLDGNLLDDDWELMVYGGVGGVPTADSDGDGYSDIQEALEGSDPLNASSVPGVPPADFSLPEIEVAITGSVVNLNWNWPSNYVNKFKFTVQSTTSLNTNFISRAIITGDTDATLFGETSATSRFYRIGISLGGTP
jgi:hypothetical protein